MVSLMDNELLPDTLRGLVSDIERADATMGRPCQFGLDASAVLEAAAEEIERLTGERDCQREQLDRNGVLIGVSHMALYEISELLPCARPCREPKTCGECGTQRGGICCGCIARVALQVPPRATRLERRRNHLEFEQSHHRQRIDRKG